MSTLNELIEQIDNVELRKRIATEVNKLNKQKKFGLVFEEHLPECTPLYDVPIKRNCKVAKYDEKSKLDMKALYTVLSVEGNNAICIPYNSNQTYRFPIDTLVCVAEFGEPIYPYLKPIDSICNAPDNDLWHALIEADNYHALQLLEYLYAGKVDCIYIDPPYNTGARDWKYNNDYVDGNDEYRHSKWLSMMEKRLAIARKLLNPNDSVMIITIDEKEYLHLGCLLEEMFPEANIQMISSLINVAGVAGNGGFYRTDEYLFILCFGTAKPQKQILPDEWKNGQTKNNKNKLYWNTLRRSGSGDSWKDSPGCFYPIFVSEDGERIVDIGNVLPLGSNPQEVPNREGCKTIWPIKSDGSYGRWQYTPDKLRLLIPKGYVKLGSFTKQTMRIEYLAQGEQRKVESGIFPIIGHRKDGSIIVDEDNYVAEYVPGSQWRIPTHNAKEYGTVLIQKILCNNRFNFPKSLYAVHDVIRFFVSNKPNALIIDFFAGSGTTMHAVNLLNAEDGGNRRCILVTNNEVSESEKRDFETRDIRPGDAEWEEKGIAHYVTWPRICCSIQGINADGDLLKGDYISTTDEPMHMSDGFKANVVFFKLGFLDKTKVSLGMQLKELLPILWLKAGAEGPCPKIEEKEFTNMLILPRNRFAVLNDESLFFEFSKKIANNDEIDTVFLVTDYEASFVSMTEYLQGKNTYQLYRDYLDNFRINAGRSLR